MAGQVDQGQNVVGTYRTPFAEYHQLMNAKDDGGYTWIQKFQAQPQNAPEDVQWLTQARQKYSDSYLGYLNGQISYEKFVLDNFENDIWRMQGFDFSNPAFWYKRYMQNDFSDPRSNTALRFDILSKSMQYAQQMDFEDVLFKSTSATNTLLNALDGKVQDIAGRPITAQTMETLLGEEWEGIKNIFDGDVDRAIKYVRSSGAEVQRLFYNDENGEPAWYLHTDGKLYKVKPYDGTRQAGYASYKGTAENPTEIWIDDNNLFGLGWSMGDAFASSFSGFAFTVAQLFAQIPMFAIDTIEGLATGDWTFDKVANTALVFQDIQESTAFSARGRIDLDGFQYGSMADWGDAVGGFAGTMAGMIVTAKFGGFLAKSKIAPVKQVGSVLNKMTNIYSGGGFKGAGAGQVAQTASFATDSFMKALGARTTFAVTFALKDGFNTLAQRTLVNDEQAFQKAALVTAVNSAITLALGSTKADDTAYFYKRMLGLSKRNVADPASQIVAGRLLGRSLFTGVTDLFDNYLTMSLAASSATKGTFEVDWDPSRAIYATLMARNAFVGAQKSGQFISNRIPATVIRDLQADAQARIQSAKTPADIQAAREFDVALRTEINTRLQGAEAKDLATGKAYWDVLEALADKLDGDTRAPIKEMVQRVHEAEKSEFFREMMVEGEKLYGELINAEQGFIQRLFLYGFRNTDGTGYGAFDKDFTKNVYGTLAAQTRANMAAMGDLRSVDDVARAIYDLYQDRDGFSQEDFDAAAKNLDIRYENGKVVISLKGVGTAAQGDATWSRTQAILKFAEKYGVLGRFDENDETQFILRAAMLKDLDDGLDTDPDTKKADNKRKKDIKQQVISNQEKEAMVKQELSAQSMKTLMDSVQRLRNTIEMTLVLARKDNITKKDIDMLRNAMGRPDASVEEILQDLHINGFIKGPVLMELVGKLGARTIRKSSYMSRARTVYELINEAMVNPGKQQENLRKINKMIDKGDDNFKSLLNDLYGKDFTKTYQESLSEIFSQQAASDIQGEIKKSYEQAQQEFVDDKPIRFSFFKEDGNTKSLSEVARELDIYDYDSNLYKGLLNLYKGGSFNKTDESKLYDVLISNRDELPRRTILIAAQGQIEKIFRDGITYADEDRVQINLAQLVTRTEQEIFDAASRNPNMDSEAILSMVAGRRSVSTLELKRLLNEELESLNLLRRRYPNQSLVEIADIENELGPLGYNDGVYDQYFAGVTALRAGEVLVEIKDANFKGATTKEEQFEIPQKSNKQSTILHRYGGTRQIDETSTIVDGSIRYFVGLITDDKSIEAQTIDNIKSQTKGQTFGGKGGANINRSYTLVGRELEQQTGVAKYVFLKNIVEEMTNGDYAKGLTTYVRDFGAGETARYRTYWNVEKIEDGRLRLTGFKGVANVAQLDPSEIKYIIPLELRDESIQEFRSLSNDSTMNMKFLNEFEYGTFDREMIVTSGPDNLSVHKLISSYMEFADAGQKTAMLDLLFRPYTNMETGEQTYGLVDSKVPLQFVGRNADGTVQDPTIVERNIYKLARMESSIQNDADRILVEVAKHFVEMSKDSAGEAERLATDPLFRKILDEDQTNDPDVIQAEYERQLELAGGRNQIDIDDSDYERFAGAFTGLIIEQEFSNLPGAIREVLATLNDKQYTTRIVYEQSPEDSFLEGNVLTMKGKKYLPVKSLIQAPEKVFEQIKGGEKAKEKFQAIKNLVGEQRSTAVRTEMISRDFPSQINNRSGFRYDADDSTMFDRIMQNAVQDANLRALQNANLDDTKAKSPLEYEKRAVDLIDRNDFYNESRSKIEMNSNQLDILDQVFDHFNDPNHPNFVVVLKDGTIFDANNLEYNAQGNRRDNSLVFEYLTRRSENSEAFDGAVIFTADNYRKNYYTNVKISGAKFDSKIMDLLSEDVKYSFGKYLVNNKENLELLDYAKVINNPKLQQRLEYEQAKWLAQRSAQQVRLRFWTDLRMDIENPDMRDELFRIIDDTVFNRDKTVDNLNKLFFDATIDRNDKGNKSVMGFLTDGVPVNEATTFKANDIVNTMVEDARSSKWITNEMGDEIVTPEVFDEAFNIIDRKARTLLTEFNTETLTQRTVPSASTINVDALVDQVSRTQAYKDLVSLKYLEQESKIPQGLNKKELSAARKELTNIVKAEVKQNVLDFANNRLQDLISLSVLKNSIDDGNNVINANALRIATRKGYGFTEAQKDFVEGVQLKQQEDELIREFKNSRKLYTDSEYYEVDGVRKYVSVAFVSDDGLEERFFFRTVSGRNQKEELNNLRDELNKTNLPKDVRDGIIKDYTDGFNSGNRFNDISRARKAMQSIINDYSIAKKGMLLAHAGRSAEFKDYVDFLGLNLKNIRLEDTAEFAALFRKVGPESTLSNSLEALREEYRLQNKFTGKDLGVQHTAIVDTKATKEIVDQIIKDFDGYSENRFEGGRMYSDFEKVLDAFEKNEGIQFDRDAVFRQTESLLNEIKGFDSDLQQDRGPIATTKTFVQLNNLIRELSVQRSGAALERAYNRALEAYNLSPVSEETRNSLNNLIPSERTDLRNLLNVLAKPGNKLVDQLSTLLRYDYEVKENKFLSPDQILQRLTNIPFALERLGLSEEMLRGSEGDIIDPFFKGTQLREIQQKLQSENKFHSTFERGFDFIGKGLNVTNKDDLRNLIMAPIFDMFSKDLSQGESFVEGRTVGLVDVPRNKKFITQVKGLINDYSEKALNAIEFGRDVADGTTQGPFKNLAPHRTSYKLTGDSSYKTFKANEAFISRTMLGVMLESIPENLRHNYVLRDKTGEYIWSKVYVYPNDNPGKVMAVKMYIHNMDQSTNVEFDQTLMKMLARDNDGDKIGFVPVSKKSKELIEGYEFASRAQFGALNELKDVINELKESVAVDKQKLSVEENLVLQYIRGQEADIDFKNEKATVDFYKNADLAKELREWHAKLETFDPNVEKARATSLLNKLSKDVQLAGEMRKLSIQRHKNSFIKDLPSIKEQLADPDLLAKSIQLPILLDDNAAEVIAFAELYPTPEVNRIKQKYNIKSLYELPELFNNRMVEFARNAENNLEYKQLLENAIEVRENKFNQEFTRLQEAYNKYVGPSESAYISKGGDYNERLTELEKLYDQMDQIKNAQNNIDPEAPLAFKSSRVKVFVSSEIPADARFTNANYTFDERFAAIRDQFLLKDTDKVSFKYEPNKEVAISRGQELYIKDGEVVRSNINGYARVYVKDGEVQGIITYESNSIGAETKISALNSAIGKTIGVSLSEATRPDGTVDEDIAHFLSLNTFKQKKVADLATIQGFKFVEGSDGNLVTRTINGKEYQGVVLEMDTAILEDTRLWANANERRVDRSGIINNVDSIFGRLEFGGNEIKQFLELMDTMNQPMAYQGADATNTVWTMSVFAPLRLLTEAQQAQFFKSYAKSGFEFSKDQYLQMFNTGHMLREGIEDILGRPLADVTVDEVESMLKKEIKGFNPKKADDKILLNLIWKSINGDLIELENNYETLYAGLGDPSSVISKRVAEVDSAERYKAELVSPLRQAAGTFIDKDGKQVKMPMYRPILTTDIAEEIGSYIDYDKFLYLMENRIHTPQDSYIDISTGFKPVSKDSLVYDESANAVSEEFYKTYPATLQASELRMRARAPIDFETFQKNKSTLPSYNGQVREIQKAGAEVPFKDKIKFLLQATYDSLRENPDNLGMVTRLRASQVLPREGETYFEDKAFTQQKGFRDTYVAGYGFVEDDQGKIRQTAIPNLVEFNNDPAKKNFGRTTKGAQNQLRQEFFAQKLLQNKNYFTENEVRESIRLAQDNGKPMKVEVPEKFFEQFNDGKVYDAAQLNLKELESDLASVGLQVRDSDDIVQSFLSNKQRAVQGINLDKEFKKDLMSSTGLSQKGDGYQAERLIQMFNNNSRTVLRSLTRNLNALDSLMTNKRQKQEFQRYYIFKYFDVAKDSEINPALKSEIQKVYGTEKSVEDIRQQFIKDYEATNPQIVREYVGLLENMFVLSKEVFSNSQFNEPIADPIRLLYPSFVDSDDPTKAGLKNALINKTVSSLEMKSFDPSTLDFDPFKAIQIYANKIGKKIALDKLADGAKELGLTDNIQTVNIAREFAEREILSNPKHTKDVLKAFDHLESELVNRFGYSFQRYLELYEDNLKGIEPSARDIVSARLDAIETLIDERLAATQDAVTNSAFAKSASSIDKNYETLDRLEAEIRNPEFSQYVDGLKETLLLRDQFYGTLASVKTDTKFLDFLKSRMPNVRITDEYMRSLESDFFVKPYDTMSLEYLKTSLTNMNRPLFLRALEGRVYATNKDFADHLNKYYFTSKPSNKALDWMRKYSNLAVKFIMGNPLKLMERIEYFTATDLYMLTNANPFALSKLGRARKELIGYQFASPTDGAELYPDVKEFLQLIGNDAGSARRADFYTRGDEIAPSKLDNPITDKTLDFIEIQNNLTRYALYLQTKEDLQKYGEIKYYGNAYVNKEGIDQFKTIEEKAWGVVSSNIPLFGDLPFVLRYTSPWLVFASFPLAQARHLGEWVKSYHKVIKDDVIRNDPKEFMRNAAMPAGMLGLEMLLAQMLISAVADMYNVDDETAEQWKKDDSFVSIFQTMFFDKPTVRQGSANPYRIVYNNLIGTGVEAATDRRTGELRDDWLSNIPIGYFNKEIAGRLNPTLKIPLEVISEKDFFGTDFRSAPYDLNYMQNMLRKVGSYVVGSQGARALTDALVLHRYQPEEKSLMYSMIQGFTNGVADEFGNSKTYKRDIKDFYAARSIVYGHLNGTQGSVFANDVQNFNDIINNEVRFSSNTNYSAEQVDEVSELLRAAMFREEDVSVVYNILLEKIDQGYSPSTLTAALNRVSVSRLIERIQDPDVFWESLTQKERAQLENGLAYERRIFPALNEVNLFSSSANNRNNFQKNIFLPFNEHRYMPYQNNQYNWYKPQRSNVYLYQNMGTFNPRYAPNSAYERWVKRR
jgi:hypothetical protein